MRKIMLQEKKESTKNVFKRHANFDFFYLFLENLINERIFLYGIPEEKVNHYFHEKIIDHITSPNIWSTIRKCLIRQENAKKFIESHLIPEIFSYILKYNEKAIESDFESQIKLASEKKCSLDFFEKMKELYEESHGFIKKTFPDNENFLIISKEKWKPIIKKCEKNIIFFERISKINPDNFSFVLLIFLSTPFFYKFQFNLIFGLLSEKENALSEEQKNMISNHADGTRNMVVLFFIFSSILGFLTKKSFTYKKKMEINILKSASESYFIFSGNKKKEISNIEEENPVINIISKKYTDPNKNLNLDLSENTEQIENKKEKIFPEKKSNPEKIKSKKSKKILEPKKEKTEIKKHQTEIINYQGSQYLRINNIHGCPTKKFFRRPPSPVDELTQRCFDQVKQKPVIHSATLQTKAGLKLLGDGEKNVFMGCSSKVKLFHEKTRVGVQTRPATDKEQAHVGCDEVMEVRLDRVIKK